MNKKIAKLKFVVILLEKYCLITIALLCLCHVYKESGEQSLKNLIY